MKSSRIWALILSFNFGIFGGNVYAGNGDPLKEHEKEGKGGLVGQYIKKSKNLLRFMI